MPTLVGEVRRGSFFFFKPLKNANLGGRGPQRIMAQLENGFPREYGLKLALVRLLEMENGFKEQQ